MEVWLSLLIGLLSIAATIGLGAWQLSKVAKAIHEDIRASQKELEKERS